jgi:hypothetical protein
VPARQAGSPKVQGQRQAVKVSDPFGPVRRNSRALRLRFVPAAATSRRMEDWRLVRPWLLLRITRNRDQGEFLYSRIFQSFGSWKLSSIALSILRCLNLYQTVIQKAVTWITVHVDRSYRSKALGSNADKRLKSFLNSRRRSQEEFCVRYFQNSSSSLIRCQRRQTHRFPQFPHQIV